MKKSYLLGSFIVITLFFSFFLSLPDSKLHLVFCDVGQGDAAYVRTPSNQDLLIDAGPNDKVLDCLGKNMPFYDRTIDVVLLSHPEKDHYSGLLSVIDRYTVKYIVIPAVTNEDQGYQKLLEKIKEKKIPVKNLYSGDKFFLGKVELDILWPGKEWVADNLSTSLSDSSTSLRTGLKVLGLATKNTDLNYFSQYLQLRYGSFDALFPGDGDSRIQPEVMEEVSLPDVDILKFPHHGSKYGVTDAFMDKVKPELTVISVGKNPWGHPTKEALDILQNRSIKYLRTDQRGNIEVVSDGTGYNINNK
ncbi:MBL fold metallo-hydrolase [Candidatus Microgenomates bacterium]|nr:MBL fold metallo-hydrolase [Candidatus Microgenomates bacterium]